MKYYTNDKKSLVIKSDNFDSDNDDIFSGEVVFVENDSDNEFPLSIGDDFDGWEKEYFTEINEKEFKEIKGITNGWNLNVFNKISNFFREPVKENPLKPYTVVYSHFFQTGSHTNSVVKVIYLECEKDKITETLEDSDIDMTQVNFIFDGHSHQTED